MVSPTGSLLTSQSIQSVRFRFPPSPRLRWIQISVLTFAVALGGRRATAQDAMPGRDSLVLHLVRLQRQVDSLRRTVERQGERLIELDERAVAATPTPAQRAAPDSARRTLASARGIYGKPFVRRYGAGTVLGGYVDVAYRNEIEAHRSAFDQQRLVPFIFSEITDRLHFGTEIEFEHGPRIEVEDGRAAGNGEINIEFATLDYRFRESLNLRGGVVLAPVGRFNLMHDSPINELTDRPLVDVLVIPSTLSEAGVGVYGTVYPTARSLVSYELYLANGFRDNAVTFTDRGRFAAVALRDARGERGDDNNFAKSIVGRVVVSPVLGMEIGLSGHRGKYATPGTRVITFPRVPGTPGDTTITLRYSGNERVTIGALDAAWQRGPFDFQGEYARVAVDLPQGMIDARPSAATMDGSYVQGAYHFGHGHLEPRATSVFTGVARYDRVALDRERSGNIRERLSVGLNWRPIPDAAIKGDFQWNWDTPDGAGRRAAAERRVVLSMASYF
ncbi:MAG: hypothetical protein NVS1B4_08590 [Gemmatimonadaceae bacterium]